MKVLYATERVHTFILSLEVRVRARTLRLVDLLEQYGHVLRLPHSRALTNGLFELRLSGTDPVRILYCFHEGDVYILHAFIKKTRAISSRDLMYAQQVRALLQSL